MSLGMSTFLLIVGLVILFFGCHYTVKYSSQLALHLGLSKGFVGITFLAVGTSLPELWASLVAAWQHNGQASLGNVLGSNIFNFLLIPGLIAGIWTLPLARRSFFYSLFVQLIASYALLALVLYVFPEQMHVVSGFLLLGSFFLFVFLEYKQEKKAWNLAQFFPLSVELENEGKVDNLLEVQQILQEQNCSFWKKKWILLSGQWHGLSPLPTLKTQSESSLEPVSHQQSGAKKFPKKFRLFLLALGSIFLMLLGCQLLVNQSEYIVFQKLHWHSLVWGVVFLAIGTSLPELMSSLYAFIRKESALSIGNLIGSGIFNVLVIPAVGLFIMPLRTQGLSGSFQMMFVSSLAFILFHRMGYLSRSAGFIFVFTYILYLVFLIQHQ